MQNRTIVSAALALAASAALVNAQTFLAVERDDVIYGLNRSNATETTQLVRGYPTGVKQSNQWGLGFMQSVHFDNVDGFQHNPNGNILGVNFGTALNGGEINTLQTVAGTNPGAFTRLFDFPTYNTANPGSPLTISRLGGLSVSPNNSMVAVSGNDSGAVYVFDYAAGDGSGSGTLLTNGRQFSSVIPVGSTHGTAWLDNDNVLVTDNTGALKRVQVSTGSVTTVATLPQAATGSFFSSVVYEPTVSPHAYVLLSGFAGATVNKVFAVDVSSGTIVNQADYSVSMNTGREMAFNSLGDLIISEFGNTTSAPLGGSIEIIANAYNAGSLSDNTSVKYYIQDQAAALSAQFSGVDVASKMLDYKSNSTVDVKGLTHVQRSFTGTAPLSELRAKILTGFAGGNWNGAGGILSSTAAASAALDGIGYADAADTANPTALPSFVVRYTLLGDANLDGTVGIADFSRLGANYNQAGFWDDGDFNYDGQIGIGDFSLLASNYNNSIGPGSTARGAAVPEPASLGLLLATGAVFVRRRR